VIISIIGGDDMKLLEVDEAANHIRELVDSDANIIWGSAFNPDLQGKIRVSVVATGIEQSAEQAEIASRPLNLGMSRGISRPAPAPAQGYAPAPAAERAPAPVAAPAPQPEPEPFDLGNEAELDDDSALELGGADELADENEGAQGNYASISGNRAPRAPLDLGAPQMQAPAAPARAARQQDELNLDPNAAEAAPPLGARRRPIGAEPAPAPAQAAPAARPAATGSTLFERMSNLSRGAKPAPAQESEDEEGGSINIPRFLGRQNNQ